MATKTSTTVKTVYRDGNKYQVKTVTVTKPDGITTTETFVEENEMDKDQAQEEFASFKKRLELRTGKENEKNDGAKEDEIEASIDETKSEVSEASGSTSDSEGEWTKYQRECLKSHNSYRAKHGAQPLVLDRKLCSVAQDWSDHLIDHNKFQHRPNSSLGENIYSSWSSSTKVKLRGGDAVDSWYKEQEKYNYDTENGNAGTGHFTQVVWAGSTKLGVGVSCKDGKVMVVANYDPPGNFRGQFLKNVFKPKI